MTNKFMKLRGAVRSECGTFETLSYMTGICTASLSHKINGHSQFDLKEMYAIMSALKLPVDQMHVYFPNEQKINRAS